MNRTVGAHVAFHNQDVEIHFSTEKWAQQRGSFLSIIMSNPETGKIRNKLYLSREQSKELYDAVREVRDEELKG